MTEDRKTPPVRVVETHISVLVFVGDRVYKLRKPVHFDFLDFTDRAVREADCQREIELNRRLAPDVYLGVADIVMDGRGDRPHGGDAGPARGAALGHPRADGSRTSISGWRELQRLSPSSMRAPGDPPAISEAGTGQALQAAWDANFDETRRFVGTILDPMADEEIHHTVSRWLASHRALLEDRIASGWVCDGHGDLQAEDIFCLDDGIRILDCIEFSDDLRYGDVCADVAFLAMDLERLGRPDAAERFVLSYEAQAGERLPRPLLHHYIAQRAYVRAKVACLQVEQGRQDAAGDARELHGLALRHARRSRQVLVLVGGLPGTGKSTLAAGLAAETGWDLLRSDEVRRELQPSVEVGRIGERHRPLRARPPSVPCTTSCSSGPTGTSTRASRSSSTPRGSMRGNVRRRCERPPRPAASSWSCAAPVRSRWRRHGSTSGRKGATTSPRQRRTFDPSWRRGWTPGRRPSRSTPPPYSCRMRLVGLAGDRAMSGPR